MLSEVLALNPSTSFRSGRHKPVEKRALKIMKSRFPHAKCDRGGCKNHTGRCSMDDWWEQAMEIAQDELTDPEDAA